MEEIRQSEGKEPVYILRDVEKKRTKGGVSFTLRVPELKVYPGEFLSVVGASGCGKSTLLDLLALVLEPSAAAEFRIRSGAMEKREIVDRNTLSDNELAAIRGRSIGYVLQNGGLFPFLTVRENIMLTAQISQTKVSDEELEKLVAALGLEDQLSKKPQHLSGGQRQRVAVARALIHRPAIILADEPTAAVDYPTALDICDELKELAAQAGSSVIMVTHDPDLVADIAETTVGFEVNRK